MTGPRNLIFLIIAAMSCLTPACSPEGGPAGASSSSEAESEDEQARDSPAQTEPDALDQAKAALAEGHGSKAFELLRKDPSREGAELIMHHYAELVAHDEPDAQRKAGSLLVQFRHWERPEDFEMMAEILASTLPTQLESEAADRRAPPILWQLNEWGYRSPDHLRLLAELAGPDPDHGNILRTQAIKFLNGQVTPELSRTLVGYLDPPSVDRFTKPILEIAAEAPHPDSTPIFAAYFEANNFYIWEICSRALGKIGSDDAVAAIEAKLEDATGETTRRRISTGLFISPHPKARPYLYKALRSEDVHTRLNAAKAFVATVTEKEKAVIKRMLQDDHPHLRIYACQAMRNLGMKVPDKPIEPDADARTLMDLLGKTREQVKADFPNAEPRHAQDVTVTGNQVWFFNKGWHLFEPDNGLRLYGNGSKGPFVRVVVTRESAINPFGIALDSPPVEIWKRLGNGEIGPAGSRLTYVIEERDDDRQLVATFSWSMAKNEIRNVVFSLRDKPEDSR